MPWLPREAAAGRCQSDSCVRRTGLHARSARSRGSCGIEPCRSRERSVSQQYVAEQADRPSAPAKKPRHKKFRTESYGERIAAERDQSTTTTQQSTPRPAERRTEPYAERRADRPAERRAERRTEVTAQRPDDLGTVAEGNAFAALGLAPRLVQRLARDGITEPFPIQAATIPDALAG